VEIKGFLRTESKLRQMRRSSDWRSSKDRPVRISQTETRCIEFNTSKSMKKRTHGPIKWRIDTNSFKEPTPTGIKGGSRNGKTAMICFEYSNFN
jgi:hypothetical protein